jgi:hypothetical protein
MQQNTKNTKKDELSDQIDSPHDRKELEEETVDVTIPDGHGNSRPGRLYSGAAW